MHRKSTTAVLIILGIAVLLYLFRGSLALPVMERALPKMLGADARKTLPDGLSIGVCGAGGPLPDPQRSGPCLVVMAGETMLLVDSGSNASRNLGRMQLPPGEIDAVLLTHFHSDHIDGLGETATLRWAGGDNLAPLPVIGPNGVQSVVDGFNQAYSHDMNYRHLHHGDSVAPLSGKGLLASTFSIPAHKDSIEVWNNNGLVVTAFHVIHDPVKPAVGYRFDYAGRSAVISGDTAPSKTVEHFSKDVDLLFHEALSRKLIKLMETSAKKVGNATIEKIMFDIQDYHTSPTEAAQIAQNAGVGQLVFYHIVPPLILPGTDKLFVNGVDDIFEGPSSIARDGTLFSLPAHSDDIVLVKEGL